MEKRPTQSRGGVKGGSPLRGQGAELPCGVWGNAPTVPRATSISNALNKGAGSEASLPVTLRSRRSAPKRLYPPLAHCRARWARPHSRSTTPCPYSPLQTDTQTQKDTRKPAAQNRWFFRHQKYSLFQLRQMNPQEHQHVRHKLARRGGAVHAARDSAPTGRSKCGMFCSCHDWLMAVRIARSTASGDVPYRRATVG